MQQRLQGGMDEKECREAASLPNALPAKGWPEVRGHYQRGEEQGEGFGCEV
jgi:hypothetical protein